ncbi:MAG: hypothetical protein AB1Z67_10160 [Candidatus Limnocylindrales bacterium]
MIQYVDDTTAYQPGVCNIGPAEIRRRRLIGYLGLAAAVVVALLLLAVDAPAWMRLGLALPVAVGLEGLIQARERFCAGFAMAGLQNMGELGSETAVEDDEARAADRRKAMRIHATAIAGSLIAGVTFAVLPI